MSELDLTCPECGEEVLDVDVKCQSCGAALTTTGVQRVVGTVLLDQYRVDEVLGQGGMSVVYRGQHQLTGQDVALKVLPPELAAHSQVKSRFLEEARALAQLDHPGIVHLYNFGQEHGAFVLAMQFIHGRTWERMILEQDAQLDWKRSVEIGIEVCRALEYAHDRGIIHRDMKPSNVLVRDSDGSACVMDFGIAKMESSSKLTATGQTMGTVRYMSPEQVRGRKVDVRTDIYSLCVTLYESLTGDTPFDGETHFEIMTKHLSEPPMSLTRRGSKVPPALEAAVMRGLAKRPDDRPESAAALREMLEASLAGKKVDPPSELALAGTAERVTADERVPKSADESTKLRVIGAKRRPRLWLSLAGAVALASAAVVFVLARSPGEGELAASGGRDGAAESGGEGGRAQTKGPFLLPGLEPAVDRRFEEPGLRVLAVSERDAAEVRDAYVRTRDRFLAYLAERGLEDGVVVKPLTVVVVPGHMMCDPRLYAGGQAAPDHCGEPGFHWYRPRESTLYLPETEEGLTMGMAEGVGFHVCLHSTRIQEACDAAFARYRPAGEN